ncbi:MAG TPA: hypothetical protein VF748_16385 [Candidatus Acidoferrum sp.]
MGWNDYGIYAPGAHDPDNPHCGCLKCYDPDWWFFGEHFGGYMEEEPARLWIDVRPPCNPQDGDVWIARGELRTWRGRQWDPPWTPPSDVPECYPKPGRRKKVEVERESGELYEEWLAKQK